MDKLELLIRKQITINEEIVEKINWSILNLKMSSSVEKEKEKLEYMRNKMFNEICSYYWVIEKIHMLQVQKEKQH